MLNLNDTNSPISVAAIGTGTGDGGVTKTELVTSGKEPNVILTVVRPLFAILIRFINSYLTMLVGLVGAGMVSNIIPASDFIHLVTKCGILSLAGAGFSFLKDLVTIFGNLEKKYPLLTGSI